MAKLIKKNEATLRAIQKIGNATLHDVASVIGDVAKESINSLYRCGQVCVVETKSMRTKQGCMKNMHVYAITEKGRQTLQDIDFPTTIELRSVRACTLDPGLHQMEHLIIPIRNPNVQEMMAEIGGRDVKITYGVTANYERYIPAKDDGTRYKPRPMRSILSMD